MIAAWDLWDSHGAMGLRYGAYEILMGLCDCGVGPMGFPWIYGIAVRDLWDAWGSVGLQCGTFGIPMRLWDCGVGLMGHKLWA